MYLIQNKLVTSSFIMSMIFASSVSYATPDLVPVNTVITGVQKDAGLLASKIISEQRQICGLNAVGSDNNLNKLAYAQAMYIKYLNENAVIDNVASIDTHYQSSLKSHERFTGTKNPYFSGLSFTDRVIAMGYKNAVYGGDENIIQEEIKVRSGLAPTAEVVAQGFVRGLLAAPYHMHTLLAPERNTVGTSLAVYNPKNPKSINKKGYVMVSVIGSTSIGADNKISGVYTYPCEGVTGTLTALYNESPSPVAGTGRDLQSDPIGQPVLIYMPKANSIKVSNISIIDQSTKESIQIALLDYDSDPHKGSEYELPRNKAFLLPITDSLKSCPTNKPWTNCGLNNYTKYKVSFDVLVDGKNIVKKEFVFTTGGTNY